MVGQIHIFDYINQKPPINSIVYFATAGKVHKATVVSHDASFAGISYPGYIKVRDMKNKTWSIKRFYLTKPDLKK